MIEALLVFTAQYVYVLLLGLQSLNVNNGHRMLAAAGSTMLGVLGFTVTAIVGGSDPTPGGPVWFAFVASGPAGIVSSMWFHPRLVRWYRKTVEGR